MKSILAILLFLVFFSSGLLYSQEIKYVWDLASLDPKSYDSIFNNQTVTPDINEFRGQKFNGFVLSIANKELGAIAYKLYTGKPLDLLNCTLMAQTLTFQKRFLLSDNQNGESGINFWPVKGEESLPMRIYVNDSITNPRFDSLKIDYNVKANNPVTERILIDEVRRIPNTHLYLGKMYYRILEKPYFFLWFVLEKRE